MQTPGQTGIVQGYNSEVKMHKLTGMGRKSKQK